MPVCAARWAWRVAAVLLVTIAATSAWTVPSFAPHRAPLSAKSRHSATERRALRMAAPAMVSRQSAVVIEEILGEKPTDVDPMSMAQPDMRRLKRKIKGVIERNLGSGGETHPLLKSSSKDFFERSEKTWRPMIALLLAMAVGEHAETVKTTNSHGNPSFFDDAMVIAEIVEIMHTSTVIHDTVLEDFEALEKGNPAHRLYSSSMAGNKVSILAGDFLLARASVLLASLRNTEVVEIMAGALEAIMKGQMQLHRPVEQDLSVATYIRNIEFRTAHLIASGCQCAAIVAGHPSSSPVAKAAYDFGLNIGIAYQVTRDMSVTEKNYEKLWKKLKQCMAKGEPVVFDAYELNEPLQRASTLIYSIEREPELEAVVRQGFKTVDQLLDARQAIERNDAVASMRRKACEHAKLAIEALALLPPGEAREALTLMSHYVVEPGQARLQRDNYQEGVFVQPDESEKGQMWGTQLREAKKSAQMGFFNVGQKMQDQVQKVSDKVSSVRQGLRGRDKKEH
mmetsp:Transcript_47323/g.115236  ORF Transcript_47323/g.115236 Transcript_47323/m.115236 type:complete len:510 (-) Transcript_47323:146-1675(-)